MSVDACVYVYVPASKAAEALRAVSGLLAAMPGRRKGPVVKVVAPTGEAVTMPALEGGPAARSRLAPGEAVDFDALVDPSGEGDEDAIFPVSLELTLGAEVLEVAFHAYESVVEPLNSEGFRERVAGLLDATGGGTAVFEGMGEWSTYTRDEAADEPIEVPGDASRHEAGVDRFAAFLAARPGPGGGGG